MGSFSSDEDLEFEYESDGGLSDVGNEEDDSAVEIDNAFYEAEDNKDSNPQLAIEQFQKVITMERKSSNFSAAGHTRCFKAALNIVTINGRLGRFQQMREVYSDLLAMMDKVTRNEAAEAIDAVLACVPACAADAAVASPSSDNHSASTSHGDLESVYELTLETLKNTNNTRLWFNTCVKLTKLYLARNDVQNARKQLHKLQSSCGVSQQVLCQDQTMVDATSKKSETFGAGDQGFEDASFVIARGAAQPLDSSQVVEVKALEIQLCALTGDLRRMKEVLGSLKFALNGITDPRTLAVISESAGKMYMNEKKWGRAHSEFLEAFKSYQESGNARIGKKMLKYLVLANILSLSSINPFDSREAKAFQNDPEIAAMHELRSAVDKCDVKIITDIVCNPKYGVSDDSFMKAHLADLLRSVRLEIILRIVKPYSSIRVQFLADTLDISCNEVMHLLVKLATDKQLDIRIDDEKGIAKITPCDGGTESTIDINAEQISWATHINFLVKSTGDANRHVIASAMSSATTNQ